MLDLTPLEGLTVAVDKVAGEKAPLALKLMAARGLAPLGPADLATAVYQLVQTGDDTIKQAALKTAVELPDNILGGALAEALDARVIDFFARRVWQKRKLVEVILLNRGTDDRTYRHLATLVGEEMLELIARNEERLLRYPDIIAALYMNPKTRMSTVQRAIELAVRNGVKVDGIPAFEEAARAIAESGSRSAAELAAEDEAFKKASAIMVDPAAALMIAAIDENERAALEEAEAKRAEELAEAAGEKEEDKKQLKDLNIAAKVRAATLGNSFTRAVLIRDTHKQVAMACIRSPGVSDAEAMHYASNRALDDDVIRYIANNRAWVRLYGVKVALLNNPKCPVGISMRLLPHLNIRDLKNLGRSKGIPSQLATAARNMLTQRNA